MFTFLQGQRSTTNEVVSILEVLDTNPEKAMVLLEEDSFHDSTSSHDQLTRLALTIETDENMSGVLEKEHLIHLQNKIKKLQASNRDICRDISNLRKNFQVIVFENISLENPWKVHKIKIGSINCLVTVFFSVTNRKWQTSRPIPASYDRTYMICDISTTF